MSTKYIYRFNLLNIRGDRLIPGVLELTRKIDTLELHDKLVDEIISSAPTPADWVVTHLSLFVTCKPSLCQRLFG